MGSLSRAERRAVFDHPPEAGFDSMLSMPWLVRIIRVPLKVQQLRILLGENERLPTDDASIRDIPDCRLIRRKTLVFQGLLWII